MKVPATEAPAVEMRAFTKSYRHGWSRILVAAVQSLSLRLAPGQVLGLLGPNGSGKSTTLKALAGLLAPTTGGCFVFGHPAGSDAARRLVGYLPESPRFAPHLTGREFLCFCAGVSSLPGRRAAARVEDVLAWSGLAGAAESRMGTYSRGMMQRIGLAQAVLHDPALVLLDEPGNGLDPHGRQVLRELVRDLAAKGKTVVFSSHLLDDAATLCDRLALLGQGRLLAEGTTGELLGVVPAKTMPSRLEQLYLEKIPHHG